MSWKTYDIGEPARVPPPTSASFVACPRDRDCYEYAPSILLEGVQFYSGRITLRDPESELSKEAVEQIELVLHRLVVDTFYTLEQWGALDLEKVRAEGAKLNRMTQDEWDAHMVRAYFRDREEDSAP